MSDKLQFVVDAHNLTSTDSNSDSIQLLAKRLWSCTRMIPTNNNKVIVEVPGGARGLRTAGRSAACQKRARL
jgi:hypothetical protein